MKKIGIIIGIIFLLGIIFFLENINLFYKSYTNKQGIIQYSTGNFLDSQKIFLDSLSFSGTTLFGKDIGKSQKYTDSILKYNIGNSLYRLGENTDNIQDKIKYFQKSLESYSGSLLLKDDIFTQQNYDFVKNKLEELSESKEGNSEKTSSDSTEEGEKDSNNSDENKSETGESSQKNKSEEDQEGQKEKKQKEGNSGENTKKSKSLEQTQSGKGEEKKGKENQNGEKKGKENNSNLTQQQNKQIEKYLQNLKQSELYNQKYFNKKPQEINRDINDLFLDPFFDDSFVRGGEKDW